MGGMSQKKDRRRIFLKAIEMSVRPTISTAKIPKPVRPSSAIRSRYSLCGYSVTMQDPTNRLQYFGTV